MGLWRFGIKIILKMYSMNRLIALMKVGAQTKESVCQLKSIGLCAYNLLRQWGSQKKLLLNGLEHDNGNIT